MLLLCVSKLAVKVLMLETPSLHVKHLTESFTKSVGSPPPMLNNVNIILVLEYMEFKYIYSINL